MTATPSPKQEKTNNSVSVNYMEVGNGNLVNVVDKNF